MSGVFGFVAFTLINNGVILTCDGKSEERHKINVTFIINSRLSYVIILHNMFK